MDSKASQVNICIITVIKNNIPTIIAAFFSFLKLITKLLGLKIVLIANKIKRNMAIMASNELTSMKEVGGRVIIILFPLLL